MKLSWQLPAPLRDSLTQYSSRNDSYKAYKDEDEDEDDVAILQDEKQHQQDAIRVPLLNARSKWTYTAIGLCSFLLVVLAASLHTKTAHAGGHAPHHPKNFTVEHRKLHVVLPTSIVTMDLCKSVLSSAILGYPSPWLIGWEKNETDAQRHAQEAALPKMKTVEHWLNSLSQKHNTDVVAFLGNPYALFQARPEVLLRRYFGSRNLADERLRKYFRPEVLELQDMQTRVVFSTEKECPSSIPAGTECQQFSADDGSTHFLSANLIMGQIGMMRALWNAAVKRAQKHANHNETFDENTIFAEIYREQEAQRSLVSEKSRGKDHSQPIGAKAKEFGISLDFSQELSYVTNAKVDETEWVLHNDSKKTHLPKDVAVSQKPFWTTASSGVPSALTWKDVPLLTHVKSRIVPVIIQQNPEASEEARLSWWSKLWFHPHARELLNSFALLPITPIAILRNATGTETRWWSSTWEKVGVKTSDHKFHEWHDFCGIPEDATELFMDDKGVWKDPRLSTTHYWPQDS